jgi:hypothetical protein
MGEGFEWGEFDESCGFHCITSTGVWYSFSIPQVHTRVPKPHSCRPRSLVKIQRWTSRSRRMWSIWSVGFMPAPLSTNDRLVYQMDLDDRRNRFASGRTKGTTSGTLLPVPGSDRV